MSVRAAFALGCNAIPAGVARRTSGVVRRGPARQSPRTPHLSGRPGAALRWATVRPQGFQPPATPDVRRVLPSVARRPAASSPRQSAESETASALSSQILCFHSDKPAEEDGRLFPLPSLGLEPFASGRGQPIETRPAVVVRGSPFRRDGPFLFQLQQQGIKSALIDCQQIPADLLDAPGNPVPME